MGRFINADAFASTGQGLLGNNMFAYCGNSPISRCDNQGDLWTEVILGVAIAGITGLANGYSSYLSDGKFGPAFLIGAGSGGIGYALSFATGNPLALVSIRSFTSLGSNVLTSVSNGEKVTIEDFCACGWDAVMDGVFSTITYYYNPFTSNVWSNMFNTIADNVADVAESWLYNVPTTQKSQHPINQSVSRRRPHNYVAHDDRILLY